MAMGNAADGTVGRCVVANPRGPFDVRDTEESAERRAEVAVNHEGRPYFCDKVGTRFGPRPE